MHFNKKKLSEVCAAALIAGGAATIIAPTIAMAATAAGTLIKNLATVTYEDANGNAYSAQSNEAIITVKQVYSAELSEDTAKTAAAGQSVYIQHTLTNTGNGTDTYTLTAADDTTITDSINADNVKIYLDSNGNGLADAGEPEITGDITLTAGESAEIVMEVAVPNSAQAGNTLGVILTAEAHEGTGAAVSNTVDDATTGNGTDGAEGTNQDLITISDNAVLNYTKAAVWSDAADPANIDPLNPLTWPKITYTLTITNTGNQAATAVSIVDGVPAGMTGVGTPVASGILNSNAGDAEPTFTTLDEGADGIDYDNDGTVAGTVPGISATDASIAPGQTISVTFEAAYDPMVFNNNSVPGSAGDMVDNRGHLTADLDGDGNPEPSIPSNPTQTELPQVFNLSADDTNTGSSPNTNDGGDDDAAATANDIQTVDQAPSGSTVLFPVILTNTGSGPDTLDITHSIGTFPPGTTFTYWDATGNVPLVDTNGEMGPDTGVLDAGEAKTIMVKAKLPAGTSGNNGGAGYSGTVTGTSANDPDPNPQSDATSLFLGNIASPGADLRDTATPHAGDDDDTLGSTEYNINADPNAGSPAYAGTVGGTVNIPFYIDNNSGSSDSFQLSAGSSWNDTTKTMGSLPAGWDVKFYKADAAGVPSGQPLTSTQLLSPNSIGGQRDLNNDGVLDSDPAFNQYVAVVTIPADPALAPANYVADNDADGTDETMDANGDTDGDQPIFIRIVSANSGADDITVDAIDVAPIRDITLTPPGANQIQPGGSVDYTHTLDNTGNTDEPLELSASNSLNTNGWNNNISVPVDTDGDGIADTSKPISQLVPGTDEIVGTDTNGNPVAMPVADADNDGNPEITIPAGVEIPLTPTVYAPADAAPGTIDTLTIMAESPDAGGPTATVDDVSEVIIGQVRLTKTVAYDPECDDTPAGGFAANLTAQIAPGECAIWEIVAENQGDAAAMNVVIRDEVTAFTSYETGSLFYSLGNGVAPAPVDDNIGTDAGEISGSSVVFYVGTSADPSTGQGGTLAPGEFATVRFSTRVD